MKFNLTASLVVGISICWLALSPCVSQTLPVDSFTILKYDFEEITRPDSVVTDRSPNGNDGVSRGATWSIVDGVAGSGIRLVAGIPYDSTDYIYIPFHSSQLLQNEFTIEFAFRATGSGTQNPRLICGLTPDYAGQGLVITWELYLRGESSPRNIVFAYRLVTGGGTIQDSITSVAQIPNGEWQRLLVSLDGIKSRIWLNGALDREKPAAGDIFQDTTQIGITIGKIHRYDDYAGLQDYFDGEIDEVRLSRIAREPRFDTLRIGNPTCSPDSPYKVDYIPVFLDNQDTVKAIDLPLEYDWDGDPIDISFAGTRLEGKPTLIGQIDVPNKRIRIGWASFSASDILGPADPTTVNIPIAKIVMPDCKRRYFSAPDTATIQLPVNPVSLELSDKFGQRYVPEFVSDSTWIRSYTPGDANGDDLTTISDAVFLITYIFGGGPASTCLLAADCTCDGIVTISDAVYLINYIFAGGPVPGASCLCSVSPLAKSEPVGTAAVDVSAKNGGLSVGLTTVSEMQALQLNLTSTGQVDHISVTCTDPRFQVFSGWVDDEYRIGVIDLTGKTTLPAGAHDLLSITYEGSGELSLKSAVVVDADAQEMNVTISSSKTTTVLPTDFVLAQNQPNPFNPTTQISFSLPKPADVNLTIFNILGEEVVTLTAGQHPAGVHTVTWDSRDGRGNPVASGVYFYRLAAGEFAATKKMLLLK